MLINQERKFGVEIEAFGADRDSVKSALLSAGIQVGGRGGWQLKGDGSIQGPHSFELVSPPMKGDQGLNQIKIVCTTLQGLGVKVNKSCGLHVHHSADDLTGRDFKNLVLLYARFENTIDELVPQSRRGFSNRYCRSFQSILPQLKASESTLEALDRIIPNRYYKLNLKAFWRHGTVEFRQHSGTIDYDKIINWVIFTQLMVERSKTTLIIGDSTEVNHNQLKNVLGRRNKQEMAPIFKYYRKRQKELAAEQSAA